MTDNGEYINKLEGDVFMDNADGFIKVFRRCRS